MHNAKNIKFFLDLKISNIHRKVVSWDSIVSIVIYYGLEGPGTESQWGARFCACPGQPFGPPNLLYNGYWGMVWTTHPHLVPRLKKELSYTSFPPLSLYGLF
jgi:hypothetical protein